MFLPQFYNECIKDNGCKIAKSPAMLIWIEHSVVFLSKTVDFDQLSKRILLNPPEKEGNELTILSLEVGDEPCNQDAQEGAQW